MLNYEKFSLNLKLTNRCNLRCRYCVSIHGQEDINEKYIDEAIMWHDKNKEKFKDFYFELSGGEVTEVVDKLEYALNQIPNDVVIKIITNGTNTKVLKVQKLLADNASRLLLVLSLDGDRSSHDKNRVDGNKCGSYDKIDFEFLLSQKWRALTISTVATLNNVESLADRIKYLHRMGFKQFGVSVDHTKIWTKDQLWLYERELCKLASYLKQYKDIEQLVPLSVINDFKKGVGKPCLCNKGYSELTIDVNGSVTPCKGISDVFSRILPWQIKLGYMLDGDKEDFGFSWSVNWETIKMSVECNKCISSYRCGCIPMRYIKNEAMSMQTSVSQLFHSICCLNQIEDKVWSCHANGL